MKLATHGRESQATSLCHQSHIFIQLSVYKEAIFTIDLLSSFNFIIPIINSV